MRVFLCLLLLAGTSLALGAPAITVDTTDLMTAQPNPPFPNVTVTDQIPVVGGATLGFEFELTTLMYLTGAGVFDEGSDGLQSGHSLALWNAQNQIFSISIPPNAQTVTDDGTSTNMDPMGRFVYVTGFAPLALAPGTYRVGAYYSDPQNNGYTLDGYIKDSTIYNSFGVTYKEAYYVGGPNLARPTTADGVGGNFGPNLLLSAVPEPPTWSLVSLMLTLWLPMALKRKQKKLS